MKLSDSLRIAVVTTIATLVLFLLVFAYTFRIFLSYKELSIRSYEVLTSWNKLDRLSNDILLHTAPVTGDYSSTIMKMRNQWTDSIIEFDTRLNNITVNNDLVSFVENPELYIEEIPSLWNLTKNELNNAQEELELIINTGLGERLVSNGFYNTFYLYRMMKAIDGDEIILILDFINSLTVLDATGEELTQLLLHMNDEIQSSVERKTNQAVVAATGVSLFLLMILLLFISTIRRIRIIEGQKQSLDRNRRLESFQLLLSGDFDKSLNVDLSNPFRVIILSPDYGTRSIDNIVGTQLVPMEEYVEAFFKGLGIPCVTVLMSENLIYSVVENDNDKNWSIFDPQELLDTLLTELSDRFSILFSIAVSSVGTDIAEMPEVHKDALEKLNYRYILPAKSIISEIPQRRPISSFIYPAGLEKKLIESIYKFNSKVYVETLNELVSMIANYHYLYIRSFILRITSVVSWTAANIHHHTPVIENEAIFNLSYRVNSCDTLKEANILLKNAGIEIINLLMGKKENKKESLIEEINNLIGENYSNQNLSASFIAEELGLTTSYLNRTYRTYTSDSITNLINQIRLDKVAELLTASKEPIKEIAELVGFINNSYFYTLFKNHFGMTPREYRTTYSN